MIAFRAERVRLVAALAALATLFASLSLLHPAAHARPRQGGTNICAMPGTHEIVSPTVWSAEGSPYILSNCSMRVTAAATLTIQAGTRVLLDEQGRLDIAGGLSVEGTQPSDVLFSSNKQPVGPGDWIGIQLLPGARVHMSGFTIQYANRVGSQASLLVQAAGSVIENGVIEQSRVDLPAMLIDRATDVVVKNVAFKQNGLAIDIRQISDQSKLASVTLTGNRFEGNGTTSAGIVQSDANVQLNLSGNQADQNTLNGVLVKSGTIIGAVHWVGGDLPYVIPSIIAVQGTLDVDAKTIVKFREGVQAGVQATRGGRLNVNGTASDKVIFTSLADDEACNSTVINCDTNSDGSQSTPAKNAWGRLDFHNDGKGGRIDYADIRFGGDPMVSIGYPDVSIMHSKLTTASGVGIEVVGPTTAQTGTAFATISDNVITKNGGHGVSAKTASGSQPYVLALTGNSFEQNNAAVSLDPDVQLETSGNSVPGNTNQINGYRVNSGRMSYPHRWKAGDLPYVLGGSLSLVQRAAVLTLEPGLVVKIADNTIWSMDLGKLLIGSPGGAKVLITSFHDDACSADAASGCDTNGDGAVTTPKQGDWERLGISKDNDGAFIYNTVLRYGGGRSKNAMIELRHPNSEIWGNEIALSSGQGLFVRQANTTIKGNYIHDNVGHAIQLEGLAVNVGVTLQDNRIEHNGGSAIDMDANCELSFVGTNVVLNNGLNGISVHGDSLKSRTWRPGSLPFVVTANVDVKGSQDGSSTLTIAPGTVVKMGPGANISTSRGKLLAEGSADQPIIFTSLLDDSAGGDVQPDVSNSPNAGDWGGIQLSSGGAGSRLKNVEVRYAGASQKAAVTIQNGNSALTESKLVDGGGGGVLIDMSPSPVDDRAITVDRNTIERMKGFGVQITTRTNLEPVVTRNTIRDCGKAAIAMDANVQPTLRDASGTKNTVEGNEINGVLVAGTLAVVRRWQSGDMPFVLDQTFTINSKLEIEAGTVVKAQLGSRLAVESGELVVPAPNSGSASVYFTSVRDDTCGDAGGVCDTLSDNDRTPTRPRPGDWGGITIAPGPGTLYGNITNAHIYYGGSIDAAVSVRRINTTLDRVDVAYSATDGVAVGAGKLTLRDSIVHDNVGIGLRIDGANTAATVEHNVFTGNKRSISNRSPGDVQTADNVAVGNEADAMLYCANVLRDTVWHNDLARQLSCEIKVDNSASLSIDPGTYLAFDTGTGLRVTSKTLKATGVIFTSSSPNPLPGSWNSVSFDTNSGGELLHSVLANGSSSSSGAIELKSSTATAKYNLIIRSLRTAVRVASGAAPVIEGNIIRQTTGSGSVNVQVTEKAKPQLLSNRITEANTGVNISSGGIPRLSLNSFFNLPDSAVRNSDSANCIDAKRNWWGDSTGPVDIKSDPRDPCGANLRNVDGKGISISDYVDYTDWLKTLPPSAPLVDLPRCGFTNQTQVRVAGDTSPNVQVTVYDGDTSVGTMAASGNGHFEGTVSLSRGTHDISFEASADGVKSPRSGFRRIQVDDSFPVDPAGVYFSYGSSLTEQHQLLHDEAGCATRCGAASGGRVVLPPGVKVVINAPISNPPGSVEFVQDGQPPVPMRPSTGNLYSSAPFQPVQGSFRIRYGAQATEQCLGYIYLGAVGVVYADTGISAPPVVSYDFESGDQGWAGEFVRTDKSSHSGSYSFTDSPDGNYQPGKTYAMSMLTPMDLRGVVAPTLRFYHRFHLAIGDSAMVEARRNTGESWKTLWTYRDANNEWHSETINLDEYAGEYSLYLRFRLQTSSSSKGDDGWYVDDVSVGSGGYLNRRYDIGEPLIAGATVRLRQRNPDTGDWSDWDGSPTGQYNPQSTDESGRYGFYGLPPAEYQAVVTAPGYGVFSTATLVVLNGIFAENAPLAVGQNLYVPYVAKSIALK